MQNPPFFFPQKVQIQEESQYFYTFTYINCGAKVETCRKTFPH